jgi:heme-degrading monooxygenase HmoA
MWAREGAMYGRLNLMQARVEDRPKMEAAADQFAPIMRGLKGFRDVKFFLDEQTGTYGALSLWDSKEDAEAAAETTRPRFEQAMAEIGLREPPQLMTVEIYEPRG